MKLRIAALLSFTTAVHGVCDVVCDGFNDSLTIDMASDMASMGMGVTVTSEDTPDAGRARLLQALGATDLPGTCADLRAAAASSEDEAACAMFALFAYRYCGCAGDPPPGSCYVCADGSPVPDLEAAPAGFAGMDMDWEEETAPPETCGELAFQTSFSVLLFGALAEGLGAMGGEGAEWDEQESHTPAAPGGAEWDTCPGAGWIQTNANTANERVVGTAASPDECIALARAEGCEIANLFSSGSGDCWCQEGHTRTEDGSGFMACWLQESHTLAAPGDAVRQGMGTQGHGDCVPVNHVNDHPGHVTCDCVGADDSCLASGGCVRDEACAGTPGSDVAADDMAMNFCAMVGLTCGCPAPDACDVCPFGLQEPYKVVEGDGETYTCEQLVQIVSLQAATLGMDCDQFAATAAEAGCLCKEEAGAAGPEATSPAEPAATSAPEAVVPEAAAPATTQAPEADGPELSSPAETAATNETPAGAPDAPGSDEDLVHSGAGPLGLFVVTLMVAVGTIVLA